MNHFKDIVIEEIFDEIRDLGEPLNPTIEQETAMKSTSFWWSLMEKN